MNKKQLSTLLIATTIASTLSLASHAQAQCVAPRDMNGVWQANDGGTYYVRQIGNQVWWLGMSGDNGRSWTNVFHGTKTGSTVQGTWADVPKGNIRSGGNLTLNVQGTTGVLGFTRAAATGGFGGSRWYQPCEDTVANPVHP